MASAVGREEVMAMKDILKGVAIGQNCQNWAVLLLFLKKVS